MSWVKVYLTCLVAWLNTSVKEVHIKQYGPYGRQVPLTFNFVLDKTDTLKTITISSGSVVDGIGFLIVDQSGKSKSLWYGGRGRDTALINLRDGEYITQISGSYGDFLGDRNLRDVAQINVHTNLVPDGYGPYGRMKDCKNIKSFKAPESSTGPIVGFFGATGSIVQSIGVSVREALDIQQHGPYARQAQPTFNFILEKGDEITKVHIQSGYVTDSLAFEVVDQSGNVKTFWSNGNVTGKVEFNNGAGRADQNHESHTINLAAGEIITQISGFEGDLYGKTHYVVQLLIHTDMNPDGYGPFGKMTDCTNITAFKSPDPSTGPIVGFFGAQDPNGGYLANLGVKRALKRTRGLSFQL